MHPGGIPHRKYFKGIRTEILQHHFARIAVPCVGDGNRGKLSRPIPAPPPCVKETEIRQAVHVKQTVRSLSLHDGFSGADGPSRRFDDLMDGDAVALDLSGFGKSFASACPRGAASQPQCPDPCTEAFQKMFCRFFHRCLSLKVSFILHIISIRPSKSRKSFTARKKRTDASKGDVAGKRGQPPAALACAIILSTSL